MNFKELCKMHEVERNALRIRCTRDYKKRAVELLAELRKRFPIKGVDMGMGAWWIKGDDFDWYVDLTDENPRREKLEMRELDHWIDEDYDDFCDSREPVGCSLKHRKLFKELGLLLNYVESERWLDCIYITEKELIEYEKTK